MQELLVLSYTCRFESGKLTTMNSFFLPVCGVVADFRTDLKPEKPKKSKS